MFFNIFFYIFQCFFSNTSSNILNISTKHWLTPHWSCKDLWTFPELHSSHVLLLHSLHYIFPTIYFEGTLYREIWSNLCLNRPILIYICIQIVLASVRLLADSSGIIIIVVLSLCYSFVKLHLCQKCTNFKSGGNAVKWEEPLWRVVALQGFCALAPLVLCCTCIPPFSLLLLISSLRSIFLVNPNDDRGSPWWWRMESIVSP